MCRASTAQHKAKALRWLSDGSVLDGELVADEDYDDEEIILSELPDEELVEQMHDDLYDGLKEEIIEGT